MARGYDAASAMFDHRYGAGERQSSWRTALQDVVGTPEWHAEMLANRVVDDVDGTLHGYGIRGTRGPSLDFLNEEITIGYGGLDDDLELELLLQEDEDDDEDEFGVLFPKLFPKQRLLKVEDKLGVFSKRRSTASKAASPAYWLRRAGHALSGRASEKAIRKHLRRKRKRLAEEAYGTLPLGLSGKVRLAPVAAAGVDTGTVELVPIDPMSALSDGADEGVNLGFQEFLEDFNR